VRDS